MWAGEARRGYAAAAGGGYLPSGFTADPFSAYATRLVDPVNGSDVSGGTPLTQTWNGSSASYQCYKSVEFAVNDYLTTGSRRIGLLASTTYTPTANIIFPANSGTSDTARVVLQGDPAATAGQIPIIDLSNCVGIGVLGPGATGAHDYVTLRKFQLQNQYNTFVGSISGTTLTVTSPPTVPLAVNTAFNTNLLLPTGTKITALGTGTGGNGTYTISASATIGAGTTFYCNQSTVDPISAIGGAGTAGGLVVEYVRVYNCIQPDGAKNVGGVYLGIGTTMNPPAKVRYCKFDSFGCGGTTYYSTHQNQCGVYMDTPTPQVEISYCSFNNMPSGVYYKFPLTNGGQYSTANPNGPLIHHSIFSLCSNGLDLGTMAVADGFFGTRIHDNLFYDLPSSYGCTAIYVATGTVQSDDLIIQNNTFAEDVGTTVYLWGVTNTQYFNNASLATGTDSAVQFSTHANASLLNSTTVLNYNAYGGTPNYELNRYGLTTGTLGYWDKYTVFNDWKTRAKGARAELPFNPDQASLTGITTANFNNAASRDYSPIAGSALLTSGQGGGYIGCYNNSSLAASALVGPGW